MFLGIIVALIIFSIIVLIHEYGHFKTARIFGVKVFEFGLGIPPKAKKLWTDKSGTEYTLNWLPIGGFVRLKGENNHYFLIYDKDKKSYKQEELAKILESDIEVFDKNGDTIGNIEKKAVLKLLKENDDKDNLLSKPYWQQSIVILAGVFMNFLLAIIIFTVLFTIGVKPIGINDKIDTNLDIKMFPTFEQAIEKGILKESPGILLYPLTGSLASLSGIKENDLLFRIDGKDIKNLDEVKNIIGENKNKELVFSIKRNEEDIDVKLVISADGKIGSYLSANITYNKDFLYKYSFPESIIYATEEVYNESMLTFKALGTLVRKLVLPKSKIEREEAMESVSGPVGIVGVVSDAMKAGFTIVLILAALISINLGAFNLLPIPALDGGRFLFMTINELIKKLTGKKGISPHIEGLIHLSFFVILIFLSIMITYNDVIKIVEK